MNPIAWIISFIQGAIVRRRFPTSVIHKGANVGQDSVLGNYSVIFRDSSLIGSSVGAYSYIQSKSVICNAEIGSFCSIASNVYVGLAKHPTQMVSTSPVFYDNNQPLPKFFIRKSIFEQAMPQTTVGADVWVGHGVMIKAGVSIGVGAIIGAGSIVTKDIPPYVIAAGNPCKIIRPRFKADIIQKLLISKWWTLDDDILMKYSSYFNDVDLFLLKLNSLGTESLSSDIQVEGKSVNGHETTQKP